MGEERQKIHVASLYEKIRLDRGGQHLSDVITECELAAAPWAATQDASKTLELALDHLEPVLVHSALLLGVSCLNFAEQPKKLYEEGIDLGMQSPRNLSVKNRIPH
jgi:hypothetical protein